MEKYPFAKTDPIIQEMDNFILGCDRRRERIKEQVLSSAYHLSKWISRAIPSRSRPHLNNYMMKFEYLRLGLRSCSLSDSLIIDIPQFSSSNATSSASRIYSHPCKSLDICSCFQSLVAIVDHANSAERHMPRTLPCR